MYTKLGNHVPFSVEQLYSCIKEGLLHEWKFKDYTTLAMVKPVLHGGGNVRISAS